MNPKTYVNHIYIYPCITPYIHCISSMYISLYDLGGVQQDKSHQAPYSTLTPRSSWRHPGSLWKREASPPKKNLSLKLQRVETKRRPQTLKGVYFGHPGLSHPFLVRGNLGSAKKGLSNAGPRTWSIFGEAGKRAVISSKGHCASCCWIIVEGTRNGPSTGLSFLCIGPLHEFLEILRV